MAYSYNQANVVNLKHLKMAAARTQNEVTDLAALVVGTIEDLVLQASLSIPTNALSANTDATTLAEGYSYKADVSITGLCEGANVTVVLTSASLAVAYAAGVCPTVIVSDGSIRFLSNSVPASALTGTVNAVQLADDSNEGE